MARNSTAESHLSPLIHAQSITFVPAAHETASPIAITAHIWKKPHKTQGTQAMPNCSGRAFAQGGLTKPQTLPQHPKGHTWCFLSVNIQMPHFRLHGNPRSLCNAELCCSAQAMWNCYTSIFLGADRNSCLDLTKRHFKYCAGHKG